MKSSILLMVFAGSAALLAYPASAGYLIGDLTDDNVVNLDDLFVVAGLWLSDYGDCPEQGLVARWKLDEDSGNATADASAAGLDGVVYGDAVWLPSDGKINGSLRFDGQDDYIEITGYKGILGASPRTCAAWIKTATPDRNIITWGELTGGKKWVVLLGSQGRLRVTVGGGNITASAPLTDGLWHHVAVVFGGANTEDIKLYADGMPQSIADVQPQSINTTAGNDVQIGAYVPVAKNFKGRIDDVRIYDYALSTGEIWSLFRRGTTDMLCRDLNGDGTIDISDFSEIAHNWRHEVPPLMINEIMADNEDTLATHVHSPGDAGLEYPDWIEILNASSQTIDLTGWSLTDNAGNLAKWRFPSGTTIAGGQYLVVFASNKEQQDYPNNYPFVDLDRYLHTNFNLSRNGEFLALVDPGGNIVHAYDHYRIDDDEYGFPPQDEDISYGIVHNEFRFSGAPTPGAANIEGFVDFIDKPDFDHYAGFYDEAFDLVMSCDTPGVTIRYTTDGSEPVEAGNGVKYTGPIRVAVPESQQPSPCFRARAFRPGYKSSATRTATFIFNASDAQKSIPVVSIVGDEQKSLFEPDGIMAIAGGYYDGGWWKPGTSSGLEDAYNYNHPIKRGMEYEKPVSVEILNSDNKDNTQIDCGIRVAGSNWHRPHYTRGNNWTGNYNKFSLKLFFRGDYGKNTFDYSLFPLFPVDSFKAVMLRGGHNDVNNPFIKDEFLRRLHKDMNRLAVGGSLGNLYINGMYKAYYNPTERIDHDFLRTHYNSDNDWDVITQRAARNGDHVQWNEMMIAFNSSTSFSEAARYIDIPDFIDYLIMQLYPTNWDWPHNNWTAARERLPDAKWRFYLWDVEGSFRTSNLNTVYLDRLRNGSGPSGKIYKALIGDPDFKQLFADRIHKHFYNNGALTKFNLEMRFRQLQKDMSKVLPGMNTYILTSWIPNRRNIIINAFTNEGLFGLQGPTFNINGSYRHGGYIEQGASLTIDNPGGAGEIWYTTDGADPRLSVPASEQTEILVPYDAEKFVLVPDDDVSTPWTGGNEPFAAESSWTDGRPHTPRILAGVGYERSSGYENRISYDIENKLYRNEYRSALVRIHFNIKSQDLPDYNLFKLNMRYDDAFVAYINGYEVARSYTLTGQPGFGATVGSHEDNGPETFDISQHLNRLKAGDNVLAIHGMNISTTSSDFIVLPELIAGARTIGAGGIAPSAVRYSPSNPVSLEKSTHVKTRILNSTNWSALTEARYVAGPVNNNLQITEIMYHPADPNSEFVELQNTGDRPINLNLVKFTEGIDFRFDDLSLAPAEHVVVVRNPDVFLADHPAYSGKIAGQFLGALDNGGETIRLEDAMGRTILESKYDDDWFDITDGDGFSLTLRDAPAGLSLGRIAHWKMDEPFGPVVGDCSGNAHNGTIRGMPFWLRYKGISDGALLFDGEDDYVEITSFQGPLGSDPRTCSAWIKTNTPHRHIVSWGLDGPAGAKWIFGLESKGRLFVGVSAGNMVGSTPLTDGKWHHVAAVFDGARTEDIRLYLDGRAEPVGNMVSQVVDTTSGNVVEIGGYSANARYFDGLIDNVSIYDRALSAEEVEALAASDKYWSDKQYWRPGAAIGGSPGRDDTGDVPRLGDVVINEILAHAHDVASDWIELHNTTDSAINIGGWFLSDDKDDYTKYEIPENTWISANDYIVFKEFETFGDINEPNAFALSENGETLYLRSGLDEDGNITGYYEEEVFGASERNVAFGRYLKSTGAWNFVPMSQNTPGPNFEGAPNADPKTGPVVITEIMYNPAPGGTYNDEEYEFVELHNTSAAPVALWRYDAAENRNIPWKLTGGVEYAFPQNTVIYPGLFLVVAGNPNAFTERYGDVADLLGPYAGRLNNGGEKVDLVKPGDLDIEGARHYIRVDRVNYDDDSGWPASADGAGDSLNRIDFNLYGNDPANWQPASPSPGQ